jgi:hypothetical protein
MRINSFLSLSLSLPEEHRDVPPEEHRDIPPEEHRDIPPEEQVRLCKPN